MTAMTQHRPWAATAAVALVIALLAAGCNSDPEEPRRERDGRAVVAVIGDSYMAGFGASSAENSMGPQMAGRLHMDLANFAVGGTGYLNGGPYGGNQSYQVQAGSAIVADANLYVVEGALNDWSLIYVDKTATLDDLKAAAGALYERLADEEGTDNVVVVGPSWPYESEDPGIVEVNDALKAEAEAAGLAYVDALEENWINTENNDEYIGPDMVHPNDLGHTYLGRKFATAISDLRE